MNQSTKTALAVVAVIGLAAAFWLALFAPQREKADELAEQTSSLRAEVVSEQQRAATSVLAKQNFQRNYQQLILLGKAVPAEAATPSLLVQLAGVSASADTSFRSITQGGEGGGGGEEAASETSAVTAEAGLAQLPLGAGVGPAGLSSMPYALEFDGGFFDIADFIRGLDSLVKTKDGQVDAKGRLVTIDGFNLTPESTESSNSGPTDNLEATFQVTTYVTPPGQGLTAGATPSGPATSTTP